MKKFGTWVLDHLKLVVTILVFGITAIVMGVYLISSYGAYQGYVKEFDKADLEKRSQQAALPLATEIVKSYSSPYGKKLSFNADELNVQTSQEEYLIGDYVDLTTSGGKITSSLSLEEASFVDIVITVQTEYSVTEGDDEIYGVKDLLSNMQVVVNGETMDDVVDLPGQNWYKLVLSGFAIPEGSVNVSISSASGKNKMMPQIKNITFYSSAALSIAEVE